MNKDNPKTKLDLSTLKTKFSKFQPYLWLLLLGVFILIYGYIYLNISSDLNQKPSQTTVSSDLKNTFQTTINQNVVNQLSQLQSSSISVQSLFNQARQNPFQ